MTNLKPSSSSRVFTCIYCSGKLRLDQSVRILQNFKGESLAVRSPAYVCEQCQRPYLKETQGDRLRRNTAEAYRKKLHLLTGAQIRDGRKALGLTRSEFAGAMGVDEQTVARWESWLVQDYATDQRLRRTCATFTSSEKYESFLTGDLSPKKFCDQIGYGNNADNLTEVFGRLQQAHRRLLMREARQQLLGTSKALRLLELPVLEASEQFGHDAQGSHKLLKEPSASMRQNAVAEIISILKCAEGGAWSATDLRKKFGLKVDALRRRQSRHQIIYWRDEGGALHYPRWQFTAKGAVLSGIQKVLRMFRSQDCWRIVRYFLSPRRQLGNRRALDLLRGGQIQAVIIHAGMHAAENTW